MFGNLAVHLALLAVGAGPEVDAAQFARIVNERSDSLKTVVFLYEGALHWVGPDNIGGSPGKFDEEFQGTFLYRVDGAGVIDYYIKKPDPTVSIVRKKKSVLNEKIEEVRGILDAKTPLDPARDIQYSKSSIGSLTDLEGPLGLFWAYYWKLQGDLVRGNYTFQDWEDVEGRNCLRFRLDMHRDGFQRDRDYRRFWVDVERNAQVVRVEEYVGGKLTTKTDISLFALTDEGGKPIWLPAHGHTAYHVWGNVTYERPVFERTIDVINGSSRANINLPDSLFTVKRDTALPTTGELEKLKGPAESSPLRKAFEAQPARKPFRTDPAGVRKRIDENLAEADRQSKELEASSPSRASWSWTAVVQSALVVLGVALLGGVAYRKWADR